MQEICRRISEWVDRLATAKVTRWEELPDIELYMDQVLAILEKQAASYWQPDDIKGITPSMINNYVKAGTIKRPFKKRYNRDHVANLIMLNSAKQVLPISDVALLLNRADAEITTAEKYDYFTVIQRQACDTIIGRMKDALAGVGDQCDKKQLFILATRMALEANMMVSASKMMIREALGNMAEPARKAPKKQ